MWLSLLLAASPPVAEPPVTPSSDAPAAPACKTVQIEGGDEAGTLARGHTQVDATKLSTGEAKPVGEPVDDVRGVAMVEALLRSNTILSWIHIGSELCLSEADGVVAVEGTHTYFTNEENVVPIAFDVRLVDGVITVTGR